MKSVLLKGSHWSSILFQTSVCILSFVLIYLVKDFPFFWDSVQLSSQQATWVYKHNSFLLPNSIDSGHPPGMGWYLAQVWTFFGRNLLSSHFAMLPWLILFLSGTGILLKRLTGYISAQWCALIFLLDPVFVSHFTLISPDLILMSAFVWALLGMYQRNAWFICLSIFVLCSISLRGMMISAVIFIFVVIRNYGSGFKRIYWSYIAFVPGFLLGILFLIYHYEAKGWIGHSIASPWAPSFERVGIIGFIRNGLVLIWRVFDFGRVGILIFLGGTFILYRKSDIFRQTGVKSLLLLILVAFVIIAPSMLIHSGILAHRYLLPIFYLITILSVVIAYLYYENRISNVFLLLVSTCVFLSGHWWKYPKGVSMGWDCSTIHWQFFPVFDETLKYMQANDISANSIYTWFPLNKKIDDLNLMGRNDAFSNVDKNRPYWLVCTVMNEAPAALLEDTIDREVLFEARNGAILIRLIRNDFNGKAQPQGVK